MTNDILDQISYPESMSEKKKEFLKKAAAGSKNLDQKGLLPYLTGLIRQTKEQNIHFSNEEIQFIIGAIKASSSQEEKNAIDKICNLRPEDFKK